MRYVDRERFERERSKDLAPLLEVSRRATQQLIHAVAKGAQPEFRSEVWQRYKPMLMDLFLSKCAYCETRVTPGGFGDVEMYRPKRHYWWLAYEWKNLLITCSVCNRRYKADRFPVEGVQATSPGEEASERPLVLDPTVDRPEDHLIFTTTAGARDVIVAGTTERGRTAILVLGLNREDLVAARGVRWQALLTLLEVGSSKRHSRDVSARLREALADSAEYVGALRQLARNWLDDHKAGGLESILDLLQPTTVKSSAHEREQAQQETAALQASLSSYSVEDASEEAHRKFECAAKRIERIEAHNLRAIHDLDFVVPAVGRNESWVMAVGENGVGKSSLLQGIALTLMGQERANARGLNAADFVRRDAKDGEGFVRVHVASVGPVELRFRRGSSTFEVDPPDPKVPLLAYGSTRLLPRDTGRAALEDRNIRVENLFDPTVPLCDADTWLVRLNHEDQKVFRDLGRAICRLLMLTDRPGPRIENGIPTVKTPDGWRPIRQLSDGYQSMVALVADIAIGATGRRRSPEDAEGIVILDEIEVHLHPQWKIQIVERFRQCFPKLSFVVTTHDPLCLKGLRKDEILILRRDNRGKVTYSANVPSVHELKTDDILTSDLFELPSSRNVTSSVTVGHYSLLLNKARRSKKEDVELEALRQRIGASLAGALTPMQRQVANALTAVMKTLRNGKRGRALTHDVVAEIQRQVTRIGREG